MTYKYNFTTAHPPLMKDIQGPPMDVPAVDLQQEIGRTNWSREEWVPDPSNRPVGPVVRVKSNIDIAVVRKKMWILTDVPHHYAQDKTFRVVTVSGYTKTERLSFATTVEGSATGALFGFGLQVRTSLGLNEETEQQWREEVTTETNTTFLANHWYASWNLVDALFATKQISVGRVEVNSRFRVIVSIYDDKVADSDIKFVSSIGAPKHVIEPLGPSYSLR